MFEVGKKYESLTTNGLVIEVLFVTDKSAFSRIVGHKYPNYIGTELNYQHDRYSHWYEHKEPRTITRWVNVYEDVKNGYLSFGNMWEDKDCAIRHGRGTDKTYMTYLDTIPITYTEPL